MGKKLLNMLLLQLCKYFESYPTSFFVCCADLVVILTESSWWSQSDRASSRRISWVGCNWIFRVIGTWRGRFSFSPINLTILSSFRIPPQGFLASNGDRWADSSLARVERPPGWVTQSTGSQLISTDSLEDVWTVTLSVLDQTLLQAAGWCSAPFTRRNGGRSTSAAGW